MSAVRGNKLCKLLVSMLLLVTLILPAGIITNAAEAATKPSIESKMTIGTGSIVGSFDYYSKEDGRYSLDVLDPVKNATYSFTSSNTKVVTVKASGTKAYLTGLKAGTATITVNQKLKGKTTKVGTCTVTVKNSVVTQDFVPELPLGASEASEPLEFAYRNNDATYTYVSNSKNFSMSETLKTFDGMYFISQSFNAKETGTYTVTVKETYNKSTRTVGTLKYVVKKATVSSESTINLGDTVWAFDLIQNFRTDINYSFAYDDDDDNIINAYEKDETVYLEGKKEGTVTLEIYEDITADDEILIGTCKVTVKKVALDNLNCEFDDIDAYVDGYPIDFYVDKEPDDAFGEITVTSSNPNVATVELDEDGNGTITPVSAGTTTITITCGDITKTQDITVSDEDDDSTDEE